MIQTFAGNLNSDQCRSANLVESDFENGATVMQIEYLLAKVDVDTAESGVLKDKYIPPVNNFANSKLPSAPHSVSSDRVRWYEYFEHIVLYSRLEVFAVSLCNILKTLRLRTFYI